MFSDLEFDALLFGRDLPKVATWRAALGRPFPKVAVDVGKPGGDQTVSVVYGKRATTITIDDIEATELLDLQKRMRDDIAAAYRMLERQIFAAAGDAGIPTSEPYSPDFILFARNALSRAKIDLMCGVSVIASFPFCGGSVL
jgi:hypothetical protein